MKVYRVTRLTAPACVAGISLAACSGGISTVAQSPATSAPPTSALAATSATTTGAAASTGPASPSLAAGLDSCVVGTWKGVHQSVTNHVGLEPATFTGPGPASAVLRPDGTGTIDFGANGETLTATVNGNVWTEVVTGSATFTYQTSNGSLLFSDAHGSGTQTLYVNGIKDVTAPATALTTDQYTCSSSTLRAFAATGTGSTEFTRTS
jgi:molecular chaperone DnaK